MKESRKSLRRLVLSLAVSVGASGLCLSLAAPRLWAQEQAVAPAAQPQLAAADLRSKAFEAVKKGEFDQSYELLTRAASLTHDPKDQKLVEWAKGFNEQINKFTAERRKEYDKAVAKIKLLREKGKLAYAMDFASGAQYLADNKEAFLKESWLVELMAEAQKRAAEHDNNGEWVRAFRLYSQLAAIDGDKPEWKEKFKTSTRRLRILALYTPDQVRKLYKEDGKERDEVEAMLKELDAKLGNGDPVVKVNPATKPATQPAEDEEQERQNRVDWRKALDGVRVDMLTEALGLARQNYYKEVEFRTVLAGGLEGLKVLVTTPALRDAFPESKLGDEQARNNFLGSLEAKLAELNQPNAQEEIRTLLDEIGKWNRQTINLPREVWVSEFADGAFTALDPFSTVIWPYGMDELTKTVRGEFSGVGIQIRVDDAGNLKVVTPIEDSPAYKARIKPDSIITHIDKQTARWISIDDAVKRITGTPGSFVTLTIKDPKGNVTEHTLKRQTLKVDTVRGWKHRMEAGGVARGWDYFIDPQEKIGYIRISQFTRSTLSDIDRAITEMRTSGGEVRGVILDLRHNPGGLLSSAVEVVDKFIDQGLIVRTAPARQDSPNGEQEFKAKDQRLTDIKDLPVIVLVNQISASASEIVSGALKDHKRALIVGERTYGKGSVQIVSQLIGSNASLKITTSHYYLPNGKCIHREENAKEWGVDPDVTIEMTPEQIRAALEVRQELDVLRDEDPLPAQGEKLPEKAEKVADAVEAAKKNRDPLSVDAQLSAALFLMRLELNQRPG